MKENDFNMTQTDADFDARCHALLANKEVAAPPPGDGLFAQPAAAWKRWGMAGGVVLLLTAGVASLSNSGEESVPTPEGVETSETLEATEMNEALELTEAGGSTVPVAATDPAAEAVPMPTSEIAVESAPSAASNVVREVAQAATATEETALMEGRSERETAVVEEVMSDSPGSTAGAVDVATESMNDPVEVPPVSAAQPSAEEGEVESIPAEEKPRLTLPLTLPSGGGQQ